MKNRTGDSLAEWSKALALGASPQGHGFEPHSCHSFEWFGGSFCTHIFPPFLRGAAIAQLGERQTEDLEVPGSIPGFGIFIWFSFRIVAGQFEKLSQGFVHYH